MYKTDSAKTANLIKRLKISSRARSELLAYVDECESTRMLLNNASTAVDNAHRSLDQSRDSLMEHNERLQQMVVRVEDLEHKSTQPVPMILACPACMTRHVDDPAFKLHHTHACQYCGFVWRPAIVPTIGVQFLPGFKN